MKSFPHCPLHQRARLGILLVLAIGMAQYSSAQPDLENAPKPPPRPIVTPEVIASEPTEPPRGGPPATTPDVTSLYTQLELLYEFLSLSPDHLQRIQRTLNLIEGMSPEERSRMRARLERMQIDLGHSEKALTRFSDYLQGTDGLEFRRFWISLRSPQREKLVRAFEATKEADRTQWVQAQLQNYRSQQQSVQQRLRNTVTRPQPPPER